MLQIPRDQPAPPPVAESVSGENDPDAVSSDDGLDAKLQEDRQALEREEAEKQAEIDRENIAAEAHNAQIRQTNFQVARSNLARPEPGRLVSAVNTNGNAGFMDDATRSQELQRALSSISENC